MAKTKFGWKAGAEQFHPTQLLDCAVAADKAGFDSLSISDHFHPWAEAGQAAFAWTWLGAAAVLTPSITLGTGLTCPILRYHPAIIAQAAATTAAMAPGRFYLGLGTGEALNEYSAVAQWPGYDTRQEMLAEAIDLIRKLWTGNEVTHDGKYYQTRKARLYTLPEEPIPIYIGSSVPGSADFAGEHGDGLLTVGGKEPEVYKAIFKAFNAGAKRAGKNPKTMPRLIELSVAYTGDEDTAIAETKKYWAGTRIPALFNHRIYTPKESEENGKAVGNDTIRNSVCISKDPQVHIDFVKGYQKLGFNHILFHSAAENQKDFVQSYGRDVISKLR